MIKKYRKIGGWGLIFLALLASGCGGGGNKAFAAPSLVVTPNPVLLSPQQTLTPNVQIADGSGAVRAPVGGVSWHIANTGVVSVDAQGVLTAQDLGKTTLTVETEGLTLTVPVTVSATATVHGRVRYEDRLYDTRGLYGSQFLPVRRALLEVWDDNNQLLMQTATDEDGRFQFDVVGGKPFRIRALAQSADATDFGFTIRDFAAQIIAATKSGLVAPLQGLNVNMDIPVNSAAGAFNILDAYTYAAEFVQTFEPRPLGSLNVYWGPFFSTYFCPGRINRDCGHDKGIYVMRQAALPLGDNSAGDNDEFDEDVLWHEFGHFIANRYSRDDSQGGSHDFASEWLDTRLAFSEGWGDYFPMAIKAWLAKRERADGIPRLSTTRLTAYVDTYYVAQQGSRARQVTDLTSLGSRVFLHSTNEVAVAKVLYEFTLREGIAQIWPVLANYFVGSAEPTSLEMFWDGWRQLGNPELARVKTIQGVLAERDIRFQPDDYEMAVADLLPSATAHPFTVCPATAITSGDSANCGERHTFYRDDGALDEDVVALNLTAGVKYLLETSRLTNGANTTISLYDESGALIKSESAKNYSILSSSMNSEDNFATALNFTPTTTGTFYARIAAPTERIVGTGRYGAYYFSAKIGG